MALHISTTTDMLIEEDTTPSADRWVSTRVSVRRALSLSAWEEAEPEQRAALPLGDKFQTHPNQESTMFSIILQCRRGGRTMTAEHGG